MTRALGSSARTSPRIYRSFSRLASLALTLGLCVGMSVGVASGPAYAHDQLLSSNPEANAKLEQPPRKISLTFSSEPMKGSAKMVASNKERQQINLGEPTINGKVVSVTWPTQDSGSYSVNWRVVSSDGHPIEGTLKFEVSGMVTAMNTPVESPSDSTSTTSATPSPSSETTESRTGGMIAGLAAAVVAATILVAMLVRRRQNKDDDAS